VPATGQTYQARVIGYDQTGDIALIQLQNASGLTTVPIGNSSSVKTGTAVVALGNAEGQGEITATPGHITALNQTITASNDAGSTASETLHGMIQTNADIVPGDSGGPLASSAGVIGIDTAGDNANDQQQVATGFAIPINTALSVARQIAGGHASSTITIGYPAFVGIFIGSGSSRDPQAQAQQQEQQNGGPGGTGGTPACSRSNADLGVPSAIAPARSGTLIIGTICGSPAASAGMTGGAVITAVNGKAVGSPDDLASILSRFHPGDTISDRPLVHVERGLVDVEVGTGTRGPGAQPGQRARDRLQVPGEVLTAEALRGGHDRVAAEHPVGGGLDHGRRHGLVDRRRHVPHVAEVGHHAVRARDGVDQRLEQVGRRMPGLVVEAPHGALDDAVVRDGVGRCAGADPAPDQAEA
jgi:S1-C subfamily serine protease